MEWKPVDSPPFNWTKVELKHTFPETTETMPGAFNWTKVELKPYMATWWGTVYSYF